MSLENDIDALAQIDLLAGFSRDHLRLIAFGSHKLSFSKGYDIFHEDQKSDGGYLILSGSVEILVNSNGSLVSKGIFGAGSLLGSMALISTVKRNFTAKVAEPCELFKISQSTMLRVISEYPELAVDLHHRISKQVTDFVQELDPIQHKLQGGFEAK